MTGDNQVELAQSASHSKARKSTSSTLIGCLMGFIVVCSIILVAVLYQVQAATMKANQQAEIKTQVPVIGILTEVLRDYKRFTKDRHLHIAASYVKWIESAGAQVMPILLNQDDEYYERAFRQTNGLLFPGGDNLLDPAKRTPMMVAADKLYRLAVEANDGGDFYPIWGTCLGLELLSVLSAQQNVLDSCEAHDVALPVQFVQRGKLFAPSRYSNLNELSHDYSKVIVDTLADSNITYNFHQKCLTDEGLARAGLSTFYRPLAYSEDKNHFKFITIMEAVRYPFFGVQFHPEKPPFEFVVKKSQQAQLNGHKPNQADLTRELIYNYEPTYTAPKKDMYEQRYLFPWHTTNGHLSTEEFIDDHVVESDEEITEEVSEAGKTKTTVMEDTNDKNEIRRIDVKVSNDDDNDEHNIYLLVESNKR